MQRNNETKPLEYIFPQFLDISTSAAGLVCALLFFNALVYQAMGRNLNSSHKLTKYKNLVQICKIIDEIADEAIEEFVSIDLSSNLRTFDIQFTMG